MTKKAKIKKIEHDLAQAKRDLQEAVKSTRSLVDDMSTLKNGLRSICKHEKGFYYDPCIPDGYQKRCLTCGKTWFILDKDVTKEIEESNYQEALEIVKSHNKKRNEAK